MTPVGGAEVAGAPGEVLAERPAVVALGVAGAEDAVDERVAVRAGVVEVALADHRRGVADGGLAQLRVVLERRQALLGADLVVQAEDRGADDLEVLGVGMTSVFVQVTWRLGLDLRLGGGCLGLAPGACRRARSSP